MTAKFKVACVQNCAGDGMVANIEDAAAQVVEAAQAGAVLVCLPEYFCFLHAEDRRMVDAARTEAGHPALDRFRVLARERGIWLLLGSMAIRAEGGRIRNRSFLIAADGSVAARYDKLHLFDVELRAGEHYRESATVAPGDRAVVAATPWGGLGLSVCYDLRFAYLYRALAQAGAAFLTVPAAFTRTTGRAHWHTLLRARAIETGSFVFAPCQCGEHPGGRWTYGHSLIIDPWGEILAEGGEEPGFIVAEVDPGRVAEVRRMIPALEHDRGFGGPEPVAS